MSRRQKFIIASSIEPSGVTWLLNCLVYLDVLCYRGATPSETWLIQGDTYQLRPKHEELKRWLPVTSERSSFNFCSQIECEWTHELPDANSADEKTILFSRDPRGSILSRYKRDYSFLPIKRFLRILDPKSLLTVPDYLDFFYRCWMARPNVLILRFEDYKENPLYTLRTATEYLGLGINDQILQRACDESTFEKAVESERLFLLNQKISEKRFMNRVGSSSEWRLDSDLQSVEDLIVQACNQTMFDLGYIPQEKRVPLAGVTFSQQVLMRPRTMEVLCASHYTRSEKLILLKALSRSSLTPKKLRFLFFALGACFQHLLFTEKLFRALRTKVQVPHLRL